MRTPSPCLESALDSLAPPPFKILGGVAMLHTGDLATAERLFSQVIRTRPAAEMMASALAGLGIAAKVRGQHERGRFLLEHAIELDERNWEYHYHLAEVHTLLGADGAALASIFRTLAAADPTSQAARQIQRNPFFAELLTHPEIAELVQQALGQNPTESASQCTPLFPSSPWGLWEAEMLAAQTRAATRGAPRSWAC